MKSQNLLLKMMLAISTTTVFSGCTKTEKTIVMQSPEVVKVEVLKPTELPLLVSSADWQPLENLLLNTGLPTETKISIAKNYIQAIAEKYNLTQDQIASEASRAFHLTSNEDATNNINSNMEKVADAIASVRSEAAAFLNIPQVRKNMYSDVRFYSESSRIQNLRQSDFVDKMKIEVLQRQVEKQTFHIFSGFQKQAEQAAEDLLIEMAKSDRRNFDNKMVEIAKMDKAQAEIESLRYAANIVHNINNVDDKTKVIMAGFVLEQVKKASEDKDNFENAIRLKIDNPDVSKAADTLSKLAGTLSKFSNNKKEQLLDMQKQLEKFSKNGELKIDLTTLTGDPNFQQKMADYGKKYAGYVDGGRELLQLAKQFGVDPTAIKQVESGLNYVDTGVKLVSAISSSNPIAIVSVVGSALGVAGMGSAEDRNQRQMQAKMDLMLSLQQRTIAELEETREDIHAIGRSLAATQIMIGNLSAQIADSSQKIYNELRLVHSDVEQIKEMVQADLRDGLSSCFLFEKQMVDYSPVDVVLSPTRGLQSNMDRCLTTLSEIDVKSNVSMAKLRSTQINTDGDVFERALNSFNKSFDNQIDKVVFNINPVETFFELVKFKNDLGKYQINEDMYSFLLTLKNAKANHIVDSAYVAAMANSVVATAPTIGLYNVSKGANIFDLVKINKKSTADFSKTIENIFNVVNLNIWQMSLMSGSGLLFMTEAEVADVNNNLPPVCEPHVNIDSLQCFLRSDALVRKNYLKNYFKKELALKGKSENEYVYWTLRSPYDNETDYLEVLLKILKEVFPSHWDLKIENVNGINSITANVAGVRTLIPTSEEMKDGSINYRPEMKYLLVARENLLDLYTEMNMNAIKDESVRRILVDNIIKKSLY